MNLTVVGKDLIGSDGGKISSFFRGKDARTTASCRVTVMSNGGATLNTRSSIDFRARNLCALLIDKADVLSKLEGLWDILDEEEKSSLTTKLPGLMIRVNNRLVKKLEKTIAKNEERISRLEKNSRSSRILDTVMGRAGGFGRILGSFLGLRPQTPPPLM